jgi:N utilization substance protein A
LIKYKNIVESVTNPDTEISLSEVNKLSAHDKNLQLGEKFQEVLPLSIFSSLQVQRICQLFKQNVLKIQKQYIYDEYLEKKGKILVGKVEDAGAYNYSINLGNNTAILPQKFKILNEQFHIGKIIKFLVLDVFPLSSNDFGKVLASRRDERFLTGLFELEVQEIQQGIVVIKKVA